MLWLVAICVICLLCGFLLLGRIPLVPAEADPSSLEISVIIPARNEETNLPPLLESLRGTVFTPAEVIVVDDASTDATASVATRNGARVLRSEPLPFGWTGKTWACHQGAQLATARYLLFLDADTRLLPNGLARIASAFSRIPGNAALSVLPFHTVEQPYEQLSLFFNILMAMGAGGFGLCTTPQLFGQSLLLHRDLYAQSGGHATVSKQILENFHLAPHIRNHNASTHTFSGRGTLAVRMFPHGFAQLCEGWRKAFAAGAAASHPLTLALSILWLSGSLLVLPLFFFAPLAALVVYLCYTLQVLWFARQVGTYHPLVVLAYPVPLFFYFALFTQSAWLRSRRARVTWRGREL